MKILDRIEELKNAVFDEGGELNQKSLQYFLLFTRLIDEAILGELQISATPDNEIYACYKDETMKHAMRFKADGTIKYVVI